MKESLKKEWYTTKEAQEITGEDSRKFTRRIREGNLKRYKMVDSHYLIHVSELEEILIKKDRIESSYIKYQETANLLGKSLKAISDMVYAGVFKDTIKIGRVSYISRVDVENYINRQNETISTSEVCEITGLSKFEVSVLISSKILKAEKVNNFFYVTKKSLNDFLQQIENGYSVKEICEQQQLSIEDVSRYKKISWLKTYKIKGFGEKIICDDYERFLGKRNSYLTIQDISKELGIKQGVVRNTLIYKGLVKCEKIDEQIYVVKREELKRFSQTLEGVKILFHGKEGHKDYFKNFVDAIGRETGHIETLIMYSDWSKRKIGKTKVKNKKLFVSYLLNTLEKLIKHLKEEIWLLTDSDIKELINANDKSFSDKDIELIFGFLKYVKKKRKCAYSDDFTVTNVNNSEVVQAKEKVYSKEEWIAYCTRLIDVKSHMGKAMANRRYAETWLLMLLHLSLAWRKSDFRKVPSPSLELIDIYGFEWFDNNEFGLEIAQIVINDIRMKSKEIRTDKTKAKVKFVIGLTLPTAIAFVICEIHRRNSTDNMEHLLSYKLRSYDYMKVLGEGLPTFSSLKCNRTLMTYQFETAVNQEGKAHIAYQLSSNSRAHKSFLDKPNDITSVYLITTNTDVSSDNISFHLFERGFFGWQIGMLLGVALDTEKFSLEKKTDLIKEISTQVSPLTVDFVSEYVNTRHGEAEELLKELMAMPIDKIREKLEEIAQFQSPALIDDSQCLKGVKNCPYNTTTACLGCKYLIPTNYVLEMVNTQLSDLIKRLEDTPISNLNKRIKYTYMIKQLVFILMDFRRAYNNFDRNYIKSFIDLKSLEGKFQALEMTKFLEIGGE